MWQALLPTCSHGICLTGVVCIWQPWKFDTSWACVPGLPVVYHTSHNITCTYHAKAVTFSHLLKIRGSTQSCYIKQYMHKLKLLRTSVLKHKQVLNGPAAYAGKSKSHRRILWSNVTCSHDHDEVTMTVGIQHKRHNNSEQYLMHHGPDLA